MKRLLSIFLIIAFCCFVFYPLTLKAHADAMTASIAGGLAYSLMESWGISFTASNSTALGIDSWMTSQVEEYANYRQSSIGELFAYEIAIDAVGKLVVGYQLYNNIIEFKDYLVSKFGLTDQNIDVDAGSVYGLTYVFSEPWYVGYRYVNISYPDTTDRTKRYNRDAGSGFCWSGDITISYESSPTSQIRVTTPLLRSDGSSFNPNASVTFGVSSNPVQTLSWNGEDYVAPTVLNPNKEWVGDFGAPPDTNLEQLINQIFEDVADNNLDVEGDVIDIPIPSPTPVPIDPDTPLGDVPWEGLDTNLQDLYNQGLEEIGAIGDAQDAITDSIGVQTGALEGAIADNAGVVSGAIDQAVSDIQDAISEQTQTLSESTSATAEATETIVEALEDEAINWQKFDLRGLFPFCIPFDIYNMLHALDASPTAPHVQLPFVIESIGFSYNIDLDFSAFDQVASVMRQMELIVYGIALAWATSKVIKW